MNKVFLLGRLVKDVEVKYLSTTNTAYIKFTIAVDKRYKKEGEERKADFINCTCFGKTGEFISKYFQKGSKILITGSIQTSSWEDAEGKKHFSTEILVDEAEFVESLKKEENKSSDGFELVTNEDELPFF